MAYSKNDLMIQIEDLGIQKNDTLLIHSSMKSIGEVGGGAETVLDAFIDYLNDGLLIFPTHTWAQMNENHLVFNPLTEPSCVGILTNLFLKRAGVVRSWHPTHSVAAIGKEASQFIRGEEIWDSPCPRKGCWGKLYDMGAKILFIGCSLNRNTIIHGVEEWNQIPMRLTDCHLPFKIMTPGGTVIDRPMRRHYFPLGDISQNYDKLEEPLLKTGIARLGRIGDAKTYVCDAREMVDFVSSLLKRNPDLFADIAPVPAEWFV